MLYPLTLINLDSNGPRFANLGPLESRFIRVKGYNIDQCPDYHPGAGGPSWIFSDEIIIN